MKKIISTLLFLATGYVSFSCDMCNCYLGLNPHFKKNTIGLRYHYTPFIGSHDDESELQEMGLTKDDFWETRTRIELHGQWYPTQKLKILFSVPYVMNTEGVHANGNEAVPGTEVIKGIGDPLVTANYQVFNYTGDSTNFSQRLFAGGGIKFPLGKWKLLEGAEAHERVHQPGTGSWDVLATAEYLTKYDRVGLNVNVSYMLTSANSQSYQFANRFNGNAVFYYQVNIKEVSIYPSIGTYFEQAGNDHDNNYPMHNSGGIILFAHAGVDVYFHNFSVNTAFQLPAIQNLNQPQPEMKYRMIAGVTYAFD
jgi:hypothetical protein